jgi:protein subunit release factor A
MIFSLEPLVQELESIEKLLESGEIYNDQKKIKDIMIRKKHLDPIVKMYHEYQKSLSDLEEAKKML